MDVVTFFLYFFLSAVDVILFIVLNVIKGFIKGRKMEQPLSIFLLEFSFALFAVYFVDLALENVCMKMTAKIIFVFLLLALLSSS